jgi:hypothetical protein
MHRHHHNIKRRQQSLLGRVNSEVGMPAETAAYWSTIQGKPTGGARRDYDRSGSALS